MLQNSLTIFCQPLSEDETAQSMVVCQDHDTFDKLSDAPTMIITIAIKQPLKVVRRNCPGTEGHNLVQLTESCESWVDLGQTFCYPSQVATLENELFF